MAAYSVAAPPIRVRRTDGESVETTSAGKSPGTALGLKKQVHKNPPAKLRFLAASGNAITLVGLILNLRYPQPARRGA